MNEGFSPCCICHLTLLFSERTVIVFVNLLNDTRYSLSGDVVLYAVIARLWFRYLPFAFLLAKTTMVSQKISTDTIVNVSDIQSGVLLLNRNKTFFVREKCSNLAIFALFKSVPDAPLGGYAITAPCYFVSYFCYGAS